jgi:hypothetical protein
MNSQSKNQVEKLFLFLMSIFLISFVMAIPTFTNPISSPINSSNYTFGQTYRFNITIADSNGTTSLNFSNVLYPATNSSTNYTVLINSLGAGTYTYNWISTNGTDSNSSAYYSYTVNKGNLVATLTSSAGWNPNYLTSTTISVSESNGGDGDVTYKIYKDLVYIGSGETGTFALGSYAYLLNSTGGANYSSNALLDSQTLTIARESGGDTIHGTLVGTGAGLGIFILYLAQALPTLLIAFALIGIVILVGWAIAGAIKKSFNL